MRIGMEKDPRVLIEFSQNEGGMNFPKKEEGKRKESERERERKKKEEETKPKKMERKKDEKRHSMHLTLTQIA